MPWPHNYFARERLRVSIGLCLCLACSGAAHSDTPLKTPAPNTSSPVSSNIPDYGSRESAPAAVPDTAAPNPVAQMGRAAEALVIVLVGVAGVVYALKRFGLVTPGENGMPGRIAFSGLGRLRAAQVPAGSAVTVISSQPLPGGAMLHVVSVAGRNLLLGVTPQSVSALTEWPTAGAATGESLVENEDFENHLARADAASLGGGIAAANARLRSLMATPSSEDNL